MRADRYSLPGRGSAANSTVCFALGITEVEPQRAGMLFERFISKERGEPPDIDVDFEHERRDEVIAYIYGKYGRERTALAAAVITYRTKGALRDAGRCRVRRRESTPDRLAGLVGQREQLPARFAEQGLTRPRRASRNGCGLPSSCAVFRAT
jgi:error-prone DNA polymerase